MATAEFTIERALSFIGVRSRETALTAREIDDGIDMMNDIMFSLDSKGIRLGYTKVSDKSDEVTVPDWSTGMVKSRLGFALAPDYDIEIGPTLSAVANEFFDTVVRRVTVLNRVAFPDNMPIGTGNRVGNDRNTPQFFTDTHFNDLDFNNGQGAGDERGRQIDIEVED